jgi:hypothetical protein
MTDKEFEDQLTELMVISDPRIVEYFKAHKEIIKEIEGLTEWKLFEDLQDAINIQHGYFKNDIGEYLYVKGIEITNDTGNLCRMGYNGEDRGVWVHYCEIDDRRAIYNDIPVTTFTYFMSNAVEEKKRLKPITKEEFEQQVQKTIQNFISDYQEKRDVNEYYDFMCGWNDMCDKVRKEYNENEEMREAFKNRLIDLDDTEKKEESND